MAKLIKNAQICTEEVFLNQPVSAAAQAEETAPLVNEAQWETLQKEAFNQGYLSGQAEEKTRAEQELNQLKQQLQEALLSIPHAVAQNRLELSKEIADIVLHITQQFFIDQQKDTQALPQQINQILAQLNNRQTVELCLHPQEISALHNGQLQLSASHLNGLKIKSDESLALGGFLIKTTHGVFDASIEKQIDKLKEVLLHIKQGEHIASLD